jgi:hypothetical protein
MKCLIRAAGLAAALFLSHPASAQWQGGIGFGVRKVTHTEYDMAGQRLVRETGWLPGMTLDLGYRTGDLTWLAAFEGYRGDIDYRGQTQAGTASNSTTSTNLATARLGAAYAVGWNASVFGAFELDRWKRDIQGAGGSAGLQETYRSNRLIAGLGKAWHPAAGMVSADVAYVYGRPERLHVGFSGLLDPVSFETRRSNGVRLGASLRPAFASWLELRARYDWIKTARSFDAPVAKGGQVVGTVAQPEHVRQGLSLTAAAVF